MPDAYRTVQEWAAWLRSLDPVTAIQVGALITDGSTTRCLAQVVDEITYAQTLAGGGSYTQDELADAIGVSSATIARRASRRIVALRG